jgi:hypothetical protein
MNEEEEQAIERLKEIEVNTYSEGKARAIDTVLNLIEKLQKENKLAKQALIKNCNIADERNQLLKENEELNKNYNSLIDKIILKIDEYDYKFEKAKKQNKNDIADYYWDLIINFKKLLGGE